MGLRHVSFKCLLSQGFRSCKRNSASASVHLILQKGDGKKEKSVRTSVPALTEARSGCSGPATPNRPRASSVAGRAAAPVGSPSLGPGHCTSPALSGCPQLGESPSALKCAPRPPPSAELGEKNRREEPFPSQGRLTSRAKRWRFHSSRGRRRSALQRSVRTRRLSKCGPHPAASASPGTR